MGAQESAAAFAQMGPFPKETSTQHEAARDVVTIHQKEPSLGDLNPLILPPELARRESIEALARIIVKKIRECGGVLPHRLETVPVCSVRFSSALPQLRLVACFEVDRLTPEQIDLLEELVKYTYPVKVRTRVGNDGKEIAPDSYPPMTPGEFDRSKTAGWYMGAEQQATDSIHPGLFLYKHLGEVNQANFLEENPTAKFIVEVREAGMYQTDLVQFIIQVASVLGRPLVRLPKSRLV